MGDGPGHREELDQRVIEAVRRQLADRHDLAVEEQRIIGGGWGFMVDGNLCVAVTRRGLTVRVGAGAKPAALAEDHVVPHQVGARETSAFVVVEPAGLADPRALDRWVERALRFVDTLP